MTPLKIVLFGMVLGFIVTNGTGPSQSSKTTNEQAVTEIAVYRIKPNKHKGFDTLLSNFRKQVSQFTGYQDYLTLQDVQRPNNYIDILHWDHLDLALTAAEAVKTGEPYQPFTTAIDSLIAYGEFYQLKLFTSKKVHNMQDKVTEVVIYKIKADQLQAYLQISEAANVFLSQQKGFNSREILRDHKEKDTFMDIVIWDSLEDAQLAMQASQTEPTLVPFFQATEEIISFSHYQHFKYFAK